MMHHADSNIGDGIVEVGHVGSPALGVAIVGLLALVPALFASPGDRAVLFPVVALLASAAVAFATHRPLRRRTPVNITLDGETVVIERANGRMRRVPRSRIERVELKLPHDALGALAAIGGGNVLVIVLGRVHQHIDLTRKTGRTMVALGAFGLVSLVAFLAVAGSGANILVGLVERCAAYPLLIGLFCAGAEFCVLSGGGRTN